MSWFQSTNLASFAKTALKEAQKTIDKALDIKEEDGQQKQNNSNQAGRNSGVSNVTDMASEFFASWGVASNQAKSVDNLDVRSTSPTADLSATGNSSKNCAISSPPKGSLINTTDSSKTSESVMTNSLTSDITVTFSPNLVPSGNNGDGEDYEIRTNTNVNSSNSKHTRSLSDTVFHSSDNLGDLVQVLDDSTYSTSVDHLPLPKKPSVSTKNTELTILPTKTELSIAKKPQTSTNVDDGGQHMESSQEQEKSNLELLQEIDLEGGGASELEDRIRSTENVISSSFPDDLHEQPATVVESSLSDGWDWTSATDSCFAGIGEEQHSKKEFTISAINKDSDLQDDEQNEVQPSPCNIALDKSEEKAQDDYLSEQNQQSPETVPDNKTNIITNKREGDDSALVTEHSCNYPSPSTASPVLPAPTSIMISSRPTSPRGTEETPPSSARVSPNFEMVSSGCAVSCTQPESSRSSSIVVVSGRESTPNSGGSGAGSSGSSEGGHDHDHDMEGEILQSPIQTVAASASSSFPITKHKKGASSASSSDIEVIPSDYSSSSGCGAPHGPASHTHTTIPNNQISVPSSHMATQTDQVESKESQIQTELESTTPSPPSEQQDISKFITTEVADILLEKDQEVQQLREEGEKLSMKQFELSQVIKKLRGKEKETETVIKGLRAEIATKNLELEKLMKTFISKEGIEQSQNETISRLNQERRKLELKVEQLSSELEDATDNVESMKATVENTSIEILELKNVISSVQRESAEVDRLTRDKAELTSRTESLQKEVDHLRSALNGSQSTHHSREGELKTQISQLTQKIHTLETRLADISSEVADATMPLSMEIEKLQGELKQQQHQSDRRELAMSSTIADLELKVKHSSEREKSAKDLQIQVQSQHSTLELRIEELESNNRHLQEQLQQKEEIFRKKFEDKTARYQKLEKNVERLTGEVERLSSENDMLSNELKAERSSFEVERRKSQTLVDQLNRANNQHGQPHHHRSNSMSTTASGSNHNSNLQHIRNDNSPRSREHSPSEHSITSEASYLDEVFDQNGGVLMMNNGNNNRSMTPKSFFESFPSAGFIESLQNQLRLREGEVVSFQEELSKNEKIRKQLNEEIANLTMQNQQLSLDMEKLSEMEQKLEEVNKNYNAVLQMYGEKVEEADELRMDLEDVKEMYKAQIEQLLKKS